MTTSDTRRPHLVERAFQAMGGTQRALESISADSSPRSVAEGAAATQGPPPGADVAASPTMPPDAALDTTSGGAPTPLVTFEAMQRAGLAQLPAGAIRTRLAEEFSVIHHQILRTIRTMEPPAEGSGRAKRVVMVTSARPGEGKSFSSLNLAASIAHGRSTKVLLVDADGKRGSLTELLGLTEVSGLRLLAADPSQSPVPLLVPTEQRNLSILAYGSPVPDQPAVPPGTTVAAAIQRLAAMLPEHVIILDTPPCLSTSDPTSLAPVVGQVLLLVKAERTSRAEVEAALDLVDACPVIQLMLNQTRQNAADTFGSYGGYGAYGAYGTYNKYSTYGPKSEQPR
jgi:protein-tyrosine kinase